MDIFEIYQHFKGNYCKVPTCMQPSKNSSRYPGVMLNENVICAVRAHKKMVTNVFLLLGKM